MRKGLLIINAAIVFGIVIIYFSVRTSVLNSTIRSLVATSEKSLALSIEFKQTGFVGFKSFYISGVNIKLTTGDTIFKSDSIVLNPRLLPLIFGKKRLQELGLFQSSLFLSDSIVKTLRQKNILDSSEVYPTSKLDYAHVLDALQQKFFAYIPNHITMRNVGMYYKNNNSYSSIFCYNFSYQDENFLSDIVFTNDGKKSPCLFTGTLDKSNHLVQASVVCSDTSKIILPYFTSRWNASVGFDSLAFSISFERQNDVMQLKGSATAANLAVLHKRIGPDTVLTRNGTIDYTLRVGQRFMELDSSSVVQVNNFSFSPYIKFEKEGSEKITIAFIRKEFEAQTLFESLPSGLFSNFEGIETTGNLAYQMKLAVDLEQPDSVLFESRLENLGFKVIKYGVTDFRTINGPFVHQVYENDRLVKNILVGPENPDFVSLEEISPYLRYSVLTSEDGDFYYHRGFNLKAFRESIAINLKEKRFARGGSTISMQLVKNVFLNRKKTISRKIEEALIVWMIENLKLSGKDRMYEVYLNIIELGPGIYGIKPASWFYFRKSPGELSLSESIYLSSIVPRPKGFKYTFDDTGHLRDYFTGYYKLVSSIMVGRNHILPSDTINLTADIELKGEAKKFLVSQDTIRNDDSLFYIKPKGFLNRLFKGL